VQTFQQKRDAQEFPPFNEKPTEESHAEKSSIPPILREGSLQSAHNTYATHSWSITGNALNSIPGGMCHWMYKSLTGHVVHHISNHLGQFTIALLIGPRNQGMALITAYGPVESRNNSTAVANQQCQVLDTTLNPREACLDDLLKKIVYNNMATPFC